MPAAVPPDWQQLALYALAAALLLLLLQKIPFVGRLVRFALSLGLLALCLFLIAQQAPYQPQLSNLAARIGLDRQEVVGGEVRIPMASDGHFWAKARVNGVERRMLVDSGATVTALSSATAAAGSVSADKALVPVAIRTANGVVPAKGATVDELKVGNATARNLKVVISPAFGNLDVLGMNFLSQLHSWRVEGRTLVLVPEKPEPERERAETS